TLFARPIDRADPRNTLPMTDDMLAPGSIPDDVMPVWISEAIVDLYGYRVGDKITLPIAATASEFLVAGVWRDYGRQFGAIQMLLSDYQKLTGDLRINTAAMWLKNDVTMEQAVDVLR